MNGQTTVALLLGGNLGNEIEYFHFATKKLIEHGFILLARSSLYRTKPVDCDPGVNDFTNQAVLGLWSDTPKKLLSLTQELEQISGRPTQHSSKESRTLDCDIIIFGKKILESPELTIPHPRARRRGFVLIPLAEIAPDLTFPDSGETVLEALNKLISDDRCVLDNCCKTHIDLSSRATLDTNCFAGSYICFESV